MLLISRMSEKLMPVKKKNQQYITQIILLKYSCFMTKLSQIIATKISIICHLHIT